MNLFEYRAAIFDLDGTLADSMHVWDHICRDWLAEKGFTPPDRLERDISLMTLTQSAEYVNRHFTTNISPAQTIGEWERMVRRQYEETVPLKEGATLLLQELSLHGIKLAMATSCFPAACESFLKRHDIQKYFPVIVYSDEVARDKTHPDIYLACAERLGIPPSGCVVFEDLYAALSGVRDAGMGFIAVFDSSCKNWSELQNEADASVLSLNELLSDSARI